MSKPAPNVNGVRLTALLFVTLLRGGAGSSSTSGHDEASSGTFYKAARSAVSNFQASQTNKEEDGGVTAAQLPAAPGISHLFSSKNVEFPGIAARLREAQQDSESTQFQLDLNAVEVSFQPDRVRAAIAPRDDKEGGSRRLQECAAGSGITVTSALHPLVEGCLEESYLFAGTEVAYASDYGIIAPGAFLVDDATEYWGALYREVTTTDEYTLACITLEPADEVHPSTATWLCLDEDDLVIYPTDSQFAVACGCGVVSPAPTASTPSPVAAVSPPTLSSSSPSSGTCAEGESFSVTSVLSGADGCYDDALGTVNGETVYTQSGGSDGGEFWVFAFPLDDEITSAAVHWWIAFIPTEASSTSFSSSDICFSVQEASTGHPAEVDGWLCPFAAASAVADVSVECGCSTGSVTPPASATATPGPSPAAILPAASTTAPVALASTVAPTATTGRDITIPPAPTVVSTPSPMVAPVSPATVVTPSPSSASTTSRGFAFTPSPVAPPTPPPTATSTTSSTVASTPSSTVALTSPPTIASTPSPTVDNEVNSTSPASTADPTSSPASIFAPSSCGETESVQMTSSAFPDLEGCYEAVSVPSSDGISAEAWSVGGTSDSEQVVIFRITDDGTAEGGSYPYILSFLSEDTDQTVTYCTSLEDSVTVHPADATWQCDLDSSGLLALVTDDELSMDCGCDDATTVDGASTSGGAVVSWSIVAFATCLMVVAGAQRSL